MACDFCRQTIFSSTKTWGYHRPSYSSVPDTVEYQDIRDCSVCSFLQTTLATAGKATASPDEKPIFSWVLSKSARIRESPYDYLTLVFRPVDDSSLPPVTLHFFHQTTIGASPQLPPRTDAPQSWNQARTWMRECQATHTRCGASEDGSGHAPTLPSVFPTRLIDVQSPLLPSDRCLLVRSDAPSFVKAPYLTLSHCWGGSLDPVKTMPDNLERRMDPTLGGMSLDELPANFAHAIEVARRLEARYIWIDAVCIIQDGEDFKLEGPKMHSIYRNSACTIAAVDAPDSLTGFLSDRPPGESSLRPVQGRGEWALEDHSWVCLDGNMWNRDLLGRVLYTRGWVFQERMLSTRILHYSIKQLFWDCAEKTACETLPAGLPLPLDASAEVDRQWRERLRLKGGQSTAPEGGHVGTKDVSFQIFWRDAVRFYTRCNLTHVLDRLNAIWGIAKVMREEVQVEYGEGLWEDDLCEQLAWRVVHSPDRVAVKNMVLGPTWSWAWTITSIEPLNRFEYNDSTRCAVNHTGEPLQLDLEPSSRGCLTGGDPPVLKTWRIAVRGALVPAYMVQTKEPSSWSISLSGPGTPLLETAAFPDVLPDGKQQECLLLTLAVTKAQRDDGHLVVGLVLDPNSPSPGEYRRLGLFRFTFPDSEAHARFGADHQEENIWLI